MAKQVQVLTWCDPCADAGEQTPGDTYQPNDGRRTLDLCPEHRQLVDQLEQLLELHGVSVEGVSRPRKAHRAPQRAQGAAQVQGSATGLQCLLCDYQAPSSGAMGSHVKRHGLSIAEVFGAQCPVCGRHAAGTHIGRAHPDESQGQGMVGAFAWARTHGDPHGVVTAAELAATQMAS